MCCVRYESGVQLKESERERQGLYTAYSNLMESENIAMAALEELYAD